MNGGLGSTTARVALSRLPLFTPRSEKTNRLIIYFVVVVFLIGVESVENLKNRCVIRVFQFERCHASRGKAMNPERIKSGKVGCVYRKSG